MRMYASNQPAERPSDAATAAVALLLNRRTKLERRTVYRTIPARYGCKVAVNTHHMREGVGLWAGMWVASA